jgi:hypothetical protein
MNRPNLRIEFRVVDSSEMRDIQADDYWEDENGVWQFRVVRMGNLLYEIMVFAHALTEWAMCQVIGISEPEIKSFDDKFLAEQAEGKHGKDEEAGDDQLAPYRHEHQCATKVERLLARLFRIRWTTYCKAVEGA